MHRHQNDALTLLYDVPSGLCIQNAFETSKNLDGRRRYTIYSRALAVLFSNPF